jgi:hypothetical protein
VRGAPPTLYCNQPLSPLLPGHAAGGGAATALSSRRGRRAAGGEGRMTAARCGRAGALGGPHWRAGGVPITTVINPSPHKPKKRSQIPFRAHRLCPRHPAGAEGLDTWPGASAHRHAALGPAVGQGAAARRASAPAAACAPADAPHRPRQPSAPAAAAAAPGAMEARCERFMLDAKAGAAQLAAPKTAKDIAKLRCAEAPRRAARRRRAAHAPPAADAAGREPDQRPSFPSQVVPLQKPGQPLHQRRAGAPASGRHALRDRGGDGSGKCSSGRQQRWRRRRRG